MNHKNRDWLYTQYVVNKRSLRAIGRECNVGGPTIKRHLVKFGIPIRTLSEAMFLAHKNDPVDVTREASDFIIGNILGDGGVFTHNHKYGVKRTSAYAHSSKYEDMCKYISNSMTDFGFSQNGRIRECVHPINKATYYAYWTRYYEELLPFRNRFYLNDKKHIPHDLIFNPEILLQWYIGDGSLNKPTGAKAYITICSQGFPIDDVKFAVAQLNRMGFISYRQPSCNGIRISIKSRDAFLGYIGECPKEIKHIYRYKWRT